MKTIRTKNDIKEEWIGVIEDIIQDLIKYEFDDYSDTDILVTNRDDFNTRIEEMIWESLNDDQDVIYTHKAKEVINIIDIYDIFDEWDLTGERFKDYSSCAFANLYDFIQNEISIDDLISKHFADKYIPS